MFYLKNLSKAQQGILLTALVAGLVIMTKWAIAPVILVLILSKSTRQYVREAVYSGLKERDALLIKIMVFATPVIFYVMASPAPPDDLLREMTAFLHQFDYRNLYWGSPRLRNGDTSYIWSWGLQWLYRYLPLNEAYLPVQYGLLLGWVVVVPLAFAKAIRKAAPELESLGVWVTVAFAVSLLWILPGFTSRIIQARPENLGALLSMAGFLVSGIAGWIIYTILMSAFIPMYWLSLVYTPSILLSEIKNRWKLISLAVFAAIFLGYWASGFQINWFAWFFGMPVAIAHRVVGVSENNPLWMDLRCVSMWVLLGFLFYAISVTKISLKKVLALVLLIVWFVLPDMVRYIDDLGPLIILLILRLLPMEFYKNTLRFPFVSSSVLALFFLLPTSITLSPLPNLKIIGAHPEQRVLTTLGPEEYFGLYENPELKFAPACELGYTRRAIQSLGIDLRKQPKHHANDYCTLLHRYHISWVLESNVSINKRTNLSNCLKLQKLDSEGYAIWQVINTPKTTAKS